MWFINRKIKYFEQVKSVYRYRSFPISLNSCVYVCLCACVYVDKFNSKVYTEMQRAKNN